MTEQRRGRPPVGPRVHINLADEDIEWLDSIVAERAEKGAPTTRAAVIREIISEVRRADEWEWLIDPDAAESLHGLLREALDGWEAAQASLHAEFCTTSDHRGRACAPRIEEIRQAVRLTGAAS